MTIQDGNAEMMQLAAALLSTGRPLYSVEEIRAFSGDCGLSPEEGYAYLIAASAGIDQEAGGENREFFEHWIKPSVHMSDVGSYRNDPYYRHVPFRGQTQGRWCYGTETIRAGELFAEGDMLLTKEGRVLPQLSFFTEEYSFPAVFENGRDWMSLAPNETVTLREPIKEASGRVLTYGLGLGYYAYMTARKPDVSRVTVIERDGNAIDLFKTNLLPYFEEPDKITLIRDDALQFAERMRPGEYDYVFADIWRDAGDGMQIYRALKPLEKKAPGTRFFYWIEKSMDLYMDDSLWP